MPVADPVLSAAGLRLGYGARPVIEGLTLTIARGSFTALIGPNGSGKSTLLRALAGLQRPSAGSVMLEGRSLSALAPRQIAARIGFLAQSPPAPEGLMVRDLVAQGRYPHRGLFGRWNAADARATSRALTLTGMLDLAQRRLDSLSGGQRQRAWIAMALAQETDILLLDEPTTWLDIAHQIEVMALLEYLVQREGKTVVAVLHDLNQAARHADQMILLREGRIMAAANPQAIMQPDILRAGFGIEALITHDPATDMPLCTPLPLRPRHNARASAADAPRPG